LLGVGQAIGLAALILVTVAVLARFLVPPMLARIASAKNNELLLILLATCLGTPRWLLACLSPCERSLPV
jgi:hypothetical protein